MSNFINHVIFFISFYYCIFCINNQKKVIDVEDERDDGQSLSLYQSEIDIVPPEIDQDPTDEQNVELDRPEDLEDLQGNKVVSLEENYFDGIDSVSSNDVDDFLAKTDNQLHYVGDNFVNKEDIEDPQISKNILINDQPNNVSSIMNTNDKLLPPSNISLTCNLLSNNILTLMWLDMHNMDKDNIQYNIYYASSIVGENGIIKTSSNKSLEFRALPGRYYSFKISSVNNISESELSEESAKCKIKSDIPYTNPNISCVDVQLSLLTSHLNISWQPLSQHYHNGDHFYYNIIYKQLYSQVEPLSIAVSSNQSYAIVKVENAAEAYSVAVQSANEVGASKAVLIWRELYSGEGVPLLTANGLAYKWLNNSHVLVKWQPINSTSPLLQGFIKGYRVRYWSMSLPEQVFINEVHESVKAPICNILTPNKIKRDIKMLANLEEDDITSIILNMTFNSMKKQQDYTNALEIIRSSALLRVVGSDKDICFTISIFNHLYEGPPSEKLCTKERQLETSYVSSKPESRIILILVILAAVILCLIIICIAVFFFLKKLKEKKPLIYTVEESPFIQSAKT